jgi:tetratricopeptide (TPR) repeat protein
MLEAGLDMPAAQLGLAELALQKGDLLKAQQHFENALAIDPTDVASLINYADFNRQLGAEDQAQQLLLRALVIAPDSALVQYSLGMSEVRRKNYPAAIAYLRAAVATGNAIPRHHYVLAVALQNQDQVAAAVDVLEKALVAWPYDYQLLTTAINFQQSLGEHTNIAKWVANLSEIAPNAPEVRSYLAR